MIDLYGRAVKLQDGELLRRSDTNRTYMMHLDKDSLLQNYRMEAGRYTTPFIPEDMLGGWESPTCQLRGHFAGHWLSAVAFHYYATGDEEARARAEHVIEELATCQDENGGEWVAAIPEKYLHWISKGKQVWAPQYTIHKLFMGLADMAEYAGSKQAIDVANKFAAWFLRWVNQFSREEFENILDVETGGMLEAWVQLYKLTQDDMYKELATAYYRGRLFDALLEGRDVLTNMHANTTIPEVLGCALAYDVFGEERYRNIVEAYWDMAVTKRGAYATGGQTDGEVWTPIMNLTSRLGDKNQEFCTVYNMMRLAEFLFRWTGDAKYADYREQNIYNGLMAQTYRRFYKPGTGQKGVVAYFLPFMPGAKKDWGTDRHSFFCCHGTSVQANANLNKGIYYQDNNALYICQYFDSQVQAVYGGTDIVIKQRRDILNGWKSPYSGKHINNETSKYASHPDKHMINITVSAKTPVQLKLFLRIPYWVKQKPELTINGKPAVYTEENGFAVLEQVWQNDTVSCLFAKGITVCPLPGSNDLAAFQYGPLTLAGLCGTQREITAKDGKHENILAHSHEREWGDWKNTFITSGQKEDIVFVPVNEIGEEQYTMYFRMTQ